jgi:hypothetical protein
MENLSKIAIRAFNEGSDNFGELPTGQVESLVYEVPNDKAIHFGSPNPKSHKYYSCTVVLNEGTSGIGFYVKDNVMDVCSGHIVFSVPVTDEIQAELDMAEVLQW